jgi:hypothetical protein
VTLDGHPVTILATDIYKGFPNDGVIGYSVLGHYAVELDQDAGRMRSYEPTAFAPEAGWMSAWPPPRSRPWPWRRTSISPRESGWSCHGKEGRMAQVPVGPFVLDDGADGIIRSGLLSRFDVTFDYFHAKIHLRRNGAAGS